MKTFIKLLPLLALAATANAQYANKPSYWQGDFTQKYDSTFGMGLRGAYGWTGDDEAKDMGGVNLDFHANIETNEYFHELALNVGFFFTDQKDNTYSNDLWRDRFQYTSALADAFEVSYDEMVWALSQYNTLQALVADLGPYAGISDIKNLTGGKNIKLSNRMPILFGYTFNVPLAAEKLYFYVGAKAGVTLTFKDVTEYANADVKYYGSNSYVPVGVSQSRSSVLGDFTFAFNAGVRVALSQKTDFVVGYELMKIDDISAYHMVTAGLSFTF